jgi:plasmid stability protein
MAQLIVRNLDEALVRKLKQQAARNGVSTEEEHRRILKAALQGERAGRRRTLKDHLLAIPEAGDDRIFSRQPGKPRRVRIA